MPMVIESVEPAIEPLAAYRRIRVLGRGFMLSVEDGPERYTVVGAGPSVVVDVERDAILVDGRRLPPKDPFGFLAELMESESPPTQPSSFPFSAGLVGFFAYDLNGLIEPSLKKKTEEDELSGLPLASLGFYRTTYIYDMNRQRGFILSLDGRKGVDSLRRLIEDSHAPQPKPFLADTECIGSSFTEGGYRDAIERALDYIAMGHVYQINLSQRLKLPACGDGLSLYAELRKDGAGRFSSFMEFDGFQIISNTPERLLRIKDGVAEIEPIKGTRPRGKNPVEDNLLIEELKGSPKERAEHLMIVDLVRNDLGRFALPGSVRVVSFQRIESMPHLHHMVSTVRAELPEGLSPLLALRECFPGGSVTGTPKIRAMELIDEFEPVPRGVYTGGLGWLDVSGRMDIAMAIRTAVYREPYLYLHVGGGIVADSDPVSEYRETLLKAEDFLNTLKRLRRCALKSSRYM